MTRQRVQRWSFSFVLVVLVAGCGTIAALPRGDVAPRELSVTRTHVAIRPEVYNVRLDPVDSAKTSGDDAGPSSGSIRLVVFPDETFEYQLTIYNNGRAPFTSAFLYLAPPRPGNVKAILFTGEQLGGHYIQLRGNGTFPAGVDRHEVLGALRDNPAGFVFRIESRGNELSGTVQATPK